MDVNIIGGQIMAEGKWEVERVTLKVAGAEFTDGWEPFAATRADFNDYVYIRRWVPQPLVKE